MAGDLPVAEGVVLLPTADDMELFALAPSLAPQNVFHEFGPRVRIAAMPEGESLPKDLDELNDDALSPGREEKLDTVGALGLSAFELRSSDPYRSRKADRSLAEAAWDTEDARSPDPVGGDGASAVPITSASPGVTGTQAMRGRIGVGLVIVSGPTPDLTFTDDEQTLVVAEVQNALTWLASQEPNGDIVWSYDIQLVDAGVAPDPSANGIENLERPWRDAAVSSMGFQTGMQGVGEYVQHLKTTLATQSAYCAFFTKYPLGHFAYAGLGGIRLVMHHKNDGWGPENIDRVFAHETCHIFGAPDEYAASGCDCGGSWGSSGGSNSNCAPCAPDGGVNCIMRNNDWALCSATPGHLGWTHL